jgi:hypothetical protein
MFSSGIHQSVFKAVQMLKNVVMNDLYACVDYTVLATPQLLRIPLNPLFSSINSDCLVFSILHWHIP